MLFCAGLPSTINGVGLLVVVLIEIHYESALYSPLADKLISIMYLIELRTEIPKR